MESIYYDTVQLKQVPRHHQEYYNLPNVNEYYKLPKVEKGKVYFIPYRKKKSNTI
jgi:hypothetical protein